MSQRRQQHHGRSAGHRGRVPGEDTEGREVVHSETIAEADETQEISRLIDENEGYDRRDHRDPEHGSSHGRKARKAGREADARSIGRKRRG